MTVHEPSPEEFGDGEEQSIVHPLSVYVYSMVTALQLHYSINRSEVAYKADVSLTLISKVLNGYSNTISMGTMRKLEEAVKVMMKERGAL